MMIYIDKFKIINAAQHESQERYSIKMALATIYDKSTIEF